MGGTNETQTVSWCCSFEAMKAEIQNELWDIMEDCFANPGWYIEGMEPGSFWRNDGYGARFIPHEAVFVQKFAFFCTNEAGAQSFHEQATKKSDSKSVSISGNYGLASASASASKTKGSDDSSQENDMKVARDGKSVIAPNLNLKLVLAKPIFPAPLRGGHSKEAKRMPEAAILKGTYASEWLGCTAQLRLAY